MINKNQSISRTRLPALLLLFTALMLAAMMPLRLWQQLHLVEDGTGFWLGGGARVVLLYVLLGVLAAVPAAGAFVMRRRTALDLTRKRRIGEGIAAALVSAAMLWDALAALRYALLLFLNFTNNIYMEGMESQAASPVQYYIRSGAMASVFECMFGIIGALFFIDLSIINFVPKRKRYLSRIMVLAPLVWAICRVLRRFSRTIAYLRVSDLFLGLLMLSALILFFLYFAKILGRAEGEGKESRLVAAGIPAAVLALVCFVPRFVAYTLLGRSASQDAQVEWCDPALALFILVFLAGRIFEIPPRQKAAAKEDGEDEQAPEEQAQQDLPEEAPQPQEAQVQPNAPEQAPKLPEYPLLEEEELIGGALLDEALDGSTLFDAVFLDQEDNEA